jgi:hypothetical protein
LEGRKGIGAAGRVLNCFVKTKKMKARESSLSRPTTIKHKKIEHSGGKRRGGGNENIHHEGIEADSHWHGAMRDGLLVTVT